MWRREEAPMKKPPRLPGLMNELHLQIPEKGSYFLITTMHQQNARYSSVPGKGHPVFFKSQGGM